MFSKLLSIIILFLVLKDVENTERVGLLVETQIGIIEGQKATDDDYYMFMGIPYAKINESNPFGDAIPSQRFASIFETNDDSAICPQLYQFTNTIQGTLDCLHLNVYVPSSASSNNRLPVLVWLHGGAFRRGLGGRYLFGPKFLVRHNIVLVTLNYRVGPYGFMCLDIPEVSGNQGLKDQLLGMKWVYQNIEAFGGDSNQITLFGESAGGHSIDYHLLANKEKLYSKVIIQSGSSLAATVLYEPDQEAPIKLAKHLGFITDDIREALKFLTKTDSNSVISASLDLDFLFKPCIERVYEESNNFLTREWIDAEIPNIANMPVLIGFNEDELMINHITQDSEHFYDNNLIASYLKRIFNFNEEQLTEREEMIHKFYFGEREISKNEMWNLIEFDSDFTYIHPIQRTIRKYIENNVGDIYYYMFSYNGARNFYKDYLNITSVPGAAHADELGYLFDISYMPHLNEDDFAMISKMTTMWTNFAKIGNPTPEVSDLLPVKWIPITDGEFYYLNINTNMTMDTRPLRKRMEFWDKFYEDNKHFQKQFLPNTK